ncbi:MAG: tRNA (guanine-N7)-methyltransferase [Gammaproteobacteria bacterium]|jgi:tRNA (guanine-N7-)-methyltransferase|nr:tRNA (guanine-N7)-methyltransferase [Gammaproteobacteria bacterium]
MQNETPPGHYRTIRSFVRRQGRTTQRQTRALEALGPKFLLSLTEEFFDFPAIFGNTYPVVLEIGFGMGHSLLEQAKQNPQTNFLGIEVHEPGVGALLAGVQEEGLTNIRVINGDAVLSLEKIPSQSLQGVQIFFPDPWHKKRHHKRRLIQLPFVNTLAEKIRAGGYLHCATDWENYAQQMLEVIEASQKFDNTSKDKTFVPRPESRPVTKFERRGLKLGHGVWDLVYIRK